MADTELPPLIHRRTLQASWRVSSETMRQKLRKGDLPPLDVDLGNVQGWYAETLRAKGVMVPDPATANQQKPAASAP
jgi:hypothetical protein